MPTHLIYSSTASHAMTRAELQTILEDARSGNAARDVTGLLVYVDGVFLQILEGERDTLTSLVSRITNDTRHRDLQIFYQAEVAQRVFANWRMAFASASAQDLAAWAGLDSTTTLAATLQSLQGRPGQVPQVIVKLLDTLAAD